jgi:drug/metabolite transporter (DMT)-like permease
VLLRSTMSFNRDRGKGVGFALTAACLFGVSTPLAKALLPHAAPVLMAGLLYLGSGAGLGLYWLARHSSKRLPSSEPRLSRIHLPWLGVVVLFGGVVAPLLLMWGLAKTPASDASLLLNFEGVFTALLAWFVFKENFDLRIATGMVLIVIGGVVLSWMGGPKLGVPWGPLAIIGACVAWAIDNNLTRKLSTNDPTQIAMIKGLVAGSVNTAMAFLTGAVGHPKIMTIVASGAIGFVGYGVSLVFFILALRYVGTVRTSAYFSTAPFIGAAGALIFLRDKPGGGFVISAVLMSLGVWLHLTERHEHEHRHEAMEHEHSHIHDEHHQHTHGPQDPPGEPHTHWHRHEDLVHSHPHFPDVHHRHRH